MPKSKLTALMPQLSGRPYGCSLFLKELSRWWLLFWLPLNNKTKTHPLPIARGLGTELIRTTSLPTNCDPKKRRTSITLPHLPGDSMDTPTPKWKTVIQFCKQRPSGGASSGASMLESQVISRSAKAILAAPFLQTLRFLPFGSRCARCWKALRTCSMEPCTCLGRPAVVDLSRETPWGRAPLFDHPKVDLNPRWFITLKRGTPGF